MWTLFWHRRSAIGEPSSPMTIITDPSPAIIIDHRPSPSRIITHPSHPCSSSITSSNQSWPILTYVANDHLASCIAWPHLSVSSPISNNRSITIFQHLSSSSFTSSMHPQAPTHPHQRPALPSSSSSPLLLRFPHNIFAFVSVVISITFVIIIYRSASSASPSS